MLYNNYMFMQNILYSVTSLLRNIHLQVMHYHMQVPSQRAYFNLEKDVYKYMQVTIAHIANMDYPRMNIGFHLAPATTSKCRPTPRMVRQG